MRFRFSIRVLLLVIALAAAACYWWVARPTIVARRFERAVNGSDFRTAQLLWIPDEELPMNFAEYLNPHFPVKSWEIEVEPRSWTDLWNCVRRIKLTLRESTRDESHAVGGKLAPVLAGPSGVDFDPAVKGGGFFY
jgi:hypothetical protein